ncbi:uncharacterized protein LOC132714143 isoform X2 [Ruditapes philippinarum]|uniref:uncharacterized protein LOC132714143 isoform X2 n=1 Tax=Ruditapes philippinarum TaxID=129788 RepID=UPI00295B4ACA|nr:uncharacterized protein LOC132714143 isoform X2 [Ruditapes philippinarum]
MLEVKAVSDSPSQMYADCTVYGSNPACNAQIRAHSGIIGSKRSSRNISQPHGAWNSVYAVNLNVSEEDNGKDVTCVVDCDEFSVDLKDTVKILLPYKVDEDDKYNNKQKTAGEASDKSIIWIILGACVLVVVIIVIAVLFIVFRKKGQTLEDKREGRVHHHTQEGHTRCAIQNSEDRPAGNLEESEHALDNDAKENRPEGNLKQSGNDDEVPIYSQPIKKKTTENPDNIYAQVNKTRKTASSPSSANSSKVEKDGQLLYADLAFDPNAAPSKAAVAKQEDSPTEYVDIDYVKTKANKEIDDDPTEQENL